MYAVLSLLVATASAAPSDAPVPASARYPYVLETAGEGRQLHLLDLEGQEIPTPDALLLIDRPEDADAYRRGERTRRIGASVCWLGAGVLGLASTFLSSTGTLDGTTSDSFGSIVVTELPSLLIPVAVGGGLVLRYVNPRRHLGAWADSDTIHAAVALHNASTQDPASLPLLAEEREAVLADRQLFLDAQGRVVDADRHAVHMKALVTRLGDTDTAADYYRARRNDRIIWFTTTGVGGGLTILGTGAVFLGALIDLIGGDDGGMVEIGGVTALVGVAGVGTGITGSFVAKARHDDPGFWYDEPTLRGKLDTYDTGLRDSLALPHGTGQIELRPLVGPGIVGVAGTF